MFLFKFDTAISVKYKNVKSFKERKGPLLLKVLKSMLLFKTFWTWIAFSSKNAIFISQNIVFSTMEDNVWFITEFWSGYYINYIYYINVMKCEIFGFVCVYL